MANMFVESMQSVEAGSLAPVGQASGATVTSLFAFVSKAIGFGEDVSVAVAGSLQTAIGSLDN